MVKPVTQYILHETILKDMFCSGIVQVLRVSMDLPPATA